ncbi:recombinase family protein [Actinophytocola sp. NPDC049390]|uniref:recombinase family protein n=1 Tax=Actinophytocola sp. NPDC049390 TaxID=3363894 RepID=UPI0037A23459
MDVESMQAIAVIRLSRMRDESTSPERQRGTISAFAGLEPDALDVVPGERDARVFPMIGRNLTIVGEAADLGVSGAIDPFEREYLGPWLSDSPPKPWNLLVAWRLDRISRSVFDTLRLLEWLEARGKYLVTISDGLDTRTTMGKAFVQLAAIFAELERNVIKERTGDSRAELKTQGRWGGEAIHYGLQSEEIPTGGYKLVLDPVGVEWINQAADWVLEGKSVAEATRRLKAHKVLAPRDRQRQIRKQPLKGDEWSESTLMQILRSKTLLGWTVTNGEADSTIHKSPPIMSALKFQRLQMTLDRNAKPKTRPAKSGSAPLSGVVLCWECLEPLWHRTQHMPAGRSRMKADRTYRYYYCKAKGHTRSIKADVLEELCERSFMAAYADVEVTEPVVIPASDHREEIAGAELAVENLAHQLATAKSATVRRIIQEELAIWEDKLATLESLPTTAGGVEHVPTGRTWKQELDRLDAEGKRALWHRVGFRFAVRQQEEFTMAIQPPALTEMWEVLNDEQKGAVRRFFREHPNGFAMSSLIERLPGILHLSAESA